MRLVSDEYLIELATERRGDILDKKIRKMADVTLEHAISFWLYPHSRKTFNHWVVEMANFIPAAPKFGSKNTIFKKKVLLSELWEVKKGDLDIYIDDVIEKENPLKPKEGYQWKLDDLSNKLEVFYDKYIDELIKLAKANKTIRPSRVKRLLTDAGLIEE